MLYLILKMHIKNFFPKEVDIQHLKVRKWKCSKCHNENDRDIDASINIMFEGLKYCFDK